MSYQSITEVPCEVFQESLDTAFDHNDSGFIRDRSAFFESLLMPENRRNFQQQLLPGGGTTRDVRLIYDQRILESDVNEDVGTELSCSATTKRGNCSQLYQLDLGKNCEVEQTIDAADWRQVCKSDNELLQKNILKMTNALMEKVATKTANESVVLMGGWASGVPNVTTDILDVRTTKEGAAPDYNPDTAEDIDFALDETNYGDRRMIFGGRDLYKYYRNIERGCCANQGLDLGRIFSDFKTAFMYDRRIGNAFGGTNQNIAVQPGAMQLVWYNHADDQAEMQAFFGRATDFTVLKMMDPLTNLPFDLVIKRECPGKLTLIARATTTLFGLPDDLFPTGDRLDGVKFTGRIRVSNP